MKKAFFKSGKGNFPLPIFFPDATRAVIKTLDSEDIEATHTPGILVNTFHLWQGLEKKVLENFGGISDFMDWKGALISDSGGFQIMSLIKKAKMEGKITDEGIVFSSGKGKRVVFGPQGSVRFQMSLGTDMVIVLDDFTDPKSSYKDAKISVERTIDWAKRSKNEFENICQKKGLTRGKRPYLLGVVQGGEYMDLRKYCTDELVKIGFDGLGWGGWPFNEGKINYESAKVIADNCPDDYLLHGLGIGKPEDIVKCHSFGFNIFDCVIPTRNGRHGNLFVYNSESIDKINISEKDFYSVVAINKDKFLDDVKPISNACDCIVCKRYSKAYLAHLFKIGDTAAMRLASIHNLRFYSILMEKLQTT